MRRLRREATGSIYVEALVAVAVVAIALVPLVAAFAITPAAQRQAGAYAAALNLARGELERLHGLTAAEWDRLKDKSETVVQDDGQVFTVTVDVEDPREPGLRDVKVTVRWADPDGNPRQVTLGTSLARRR